MKRRRLLVPILAVLLCPLALVTGIYLGGHPSLLPDPARETLVADSEGRLYEEALDAIAEDYYRPVDRRDLLNKGLDGVVESLSDQFSNYFSPTDYEKFEQSTSGHFVGIGVSVKEDAKIATGLEIVEVYPGSPARRAGMRKGDLITKVDGRPTRGRSTEEVTADIRGPAGTEVGLTFGPRDRQRTARVARDEVALPIVRAKMRRAGGGEYAHVRLASFTSGAHAEVGGEVRRLLKAGADGVVLDLRDNGGGLLDEAVLISSIFIPEGTVVSTYRRNKSDRRVYKATGNAIDPKVPVIVLVNKRSASASEIVAGALQDRDRAQLVGTSTYGKGVFQEVKPLSNGGALDITVGEYFLPSGRNLGGGGIKQGAGIKPDIQASDDPDTRPDEALDRALAVLSGT